MNIFRDLINESNENNLKKRISKLAGINENKILNEGYTHYWKNKSHKAFHDEQWQKIKNATKEIIRKAEADGIPIAGRDGKGKPEITDTYILLNGEGDNAHERFYLEKNPKDFEFTKTARKPYDAVVTSILQYIHKIAPNVLNISSDGDGEAKSGAMVTDKPKYSVTGSEDENYPKGQMKLFNKDKKEDAEGSMSNMKEELDEYEYKGIEKPKTNKISREKMISSLVKNDLETGDEAYLKEILRLGTQGYENLSDKELKELYDEISNIK